MFFVFPPCISSYKVILILNKHIFALCKRPFSCGPNALKMMQEKFSAEDNSNYCQNITTKNVRAVNFVIQHQLGEMANWHIISVWIFFLRLAAPPWNFVLCYHGSFRWLRSFRT